MALWIFFLALQNHPCNLCLIDGLWSPPLAHLAIVNWPKGHHSILGWGFKSNNLVSIFFFCVSWWDLCSLSNATRWSLAGRHFLYLMLSTFASLWFTPYIEIVSVSVKRYVGRLVQREDGKSEERGGPDERPVCCSSCGTTLAHLHVAFPMWLWVIS